MKKSSPSSIARLLAVAALLATSALAQTAAPARQARLVVTGSSVLAPLVTEISRRFARQHPGVAVEVHISGSGKAVAELRAGAADIGMLSRGLRGNESNLFGFAMARDGVAVVVHRDNPAKAITAAQLADVLTGRTKSWKPLGGRDAPIEVAWRSKGEGGVEVVLEQLRLRREQIAQHTSIATPAEALQFVSRRPNGLAFASVGDVESRARAGASVKALAYESVIASTAAVQNHSYALSRPLMLVTRQMPEGVQKQFIDYALSNDVVDLLAKYSFVAYRE